VVIGTIPIWFSKWFIVAATAVATGADIAAATAAQPCIGAAFTDVGWHMAAADMPVIAIPTIKPVVVDTTAAGSIVVVRSIAAAPFIVVAIADTPALAIVARMLPTAAA